jgi:hypothetical protein
MHKKVGLSNKTYCKKKKKKKKKKNIRKIYKKDDDLLYSPYKPGMDRLIRNKITTIYEAA